MWGPACWQHPVCSASARRTGILARLGCSWGSTCVKSLRKGQADPHTVLCLLGGCMAQPTATMLQASPSLASHGQILA